MGKNRTSSAAGRGFDLIKCFLPLPVVFSQPWRSAAGVFWRAVAGRGCRAGLSQVTGGEPHDDKLPGSGRGVLCPFHVLARRLALPKTGGGLRGTNNPAPGFGLPWCGERSCPLPGDHSAVLWRCGKPAMAAQGNAIRQATRRCVAWGWSVRHCMGSRLAVKGKMLEFLGKC
jgi:hypothetical protein